MIITPGFVGIDVSKHWLDVFDAAVGRHERIANTHEAISALTVRLITSTSTVIFEATGHYDRVLRETLEVAGVRFARVNPSHARRFAQAAGFLAKTDRVDAKMLAAFGQCLNPVSAAASEPARERLARLSKRRDQLVAMRQQERVRRSECQDHELSALIAEHLDWLDKAIAACNKTIQGIIKADAEFVRMSRLLRSVPGIGPIAATILMAQAPELGARSPKAIAALVGLAPLNVDSGQFRGKRKIRGGRKRVRDALYMAALTAARSNTRLGAFYTALRTAGKSPKVALIALARKLLVILNAIMRDQVPFRAA